MSQVPTRIRTAVSAVVLVLLLGAGPGASTAGAQERDTLVVVPRPEPVQEDVDLPEVDEPASPGGAFVRALALPGWGHAAIGEYTRGAFYFAAESTTLWMLVRTVRRRSAASQARDFHERIVEARLREQGIDDPAELEEALAGHPAVAPARSLVRARDQQFEDWLALGIFLAFLGGADAFVSAHLLDFPEPVQVGIRPVGDRLELGLSVRLPPTR